MGKFISCHLYRRRDSDQPTKPIPASRLSPDLCKLMDLRLGKSLARESSDSSMVVRLLLARMSVSSDGNIIPNFRISVQS